jgi:hypothetical protein
MMEGTKIKVILLPSDLIGKKSDPLNCSDENINSDHEHINEILTSTNEGHVLSEFRIPEKIILMLNNPKTKSDLTDIISSAPHVLHFSGQTETVRDFLTDSTYLIEILKSQTGTIACIVLASCFTDEIAKMLLPYTKCVIGTSSKMSYDLSINFLGAFYKYLCLGKNLQEAYNMAYTSQTYNEERPICVSNDTAEVKKIVLLEKHELFMELNYQSEAEAHQLIKLLISNKSKILLYRGDEYHE